MQQEVWEVKDSYKISIAGKEFLVSDIVTEADILDAAKQAGVKKFIVKDEAGNLINRQHLPVRRNLIIEPYNEAA